MATKAKPITYNDNDRAIVNALKGAENGLTLTEINETSPLGLRLVSGNIVSAMKKGLIAATGEKEVERPTTRSVSTYKFVTDEVLNSATGKPFNYTDNEKSVLGAAKGIEAEDFTLAELAAAMNIEKLSSGSINGLVKKGNIAKAGSREVAGVTKTTVKVYSFVMDIPESAE